MATAEPSVGDDERRRSLHTESLSHVDLRVLSQSDLCSLSLSESSASAPNRCQDDVVIPKIDRSVFNESAGSRKQTYSRLRLAPRGKPPLAAVPARASASYIPLDEENTQIIALLQNLFGVESLRTAAAAGNVGGGVDGLVAVQVEFKQPESDTPAFQNIPIHVVDEGTARKRKRGRPRRDESSEALVIRGEEPPPQPQPQPQPKKEDDEGFAEDVRDPFVEEVKRRTLGMETEAQIMEFLEGLKGEWASDRKKRRVVEASDLGQFLPSGWKVVLTLQKRAGRASVVCGRYVSPYGHKFVSFKEVSAYLLSFYGEDINLVKTSSTDGILQFPSNINVASGRVVGHVPTGEMKTDVSASCLQASTSVHSHHEKQATVSSSIGREKLNTSDGNLNSSLAWGCELVDTTGGAFDRQTEDKQPTMDNKNNANSTQGCPLEEDSAHNQNMVDTIEAIDAACNLHIPLVFSSPFPDNNNNSGTYQLPDAINAVTCIKSSINNFASENSNTGCHETAPCGNEPAHVDNNGHGLSLRLVKDHRQKVGFKSIMLSPNSEGRRFACSNLKDRHIISSQVNMEIRGGKPAKDEKPHNISCSDQSEIKDVSSYVKLQSSSDVPSQKELKHTSINISDRIQTFMPKDSAIGNFFDSVPSGYTHNVYLSTCTKDASEYGGIDIASNLSVAKDISDNHAAPSEGLVACCAQENNSLNGQNFEVDNLMQASSTSSLLTSFGDVDPSVFYDNVNNISAGTVDAHKAVDAGRKKSQLGIVPCSNDVAIDAYTNASIIQGRSQGCESVALGGSVLNGFDKQSMDGVNISNKSCLSENGKSEQVDILRTNSTECSGNHKALLVYSQFPIKDDSLEKTIGWGDTILLIDSAVRAGGFSIEGCFAVLV